MLQVLFSLGVNTDMAADTGHICAHGGCPNGLVQLLPIVPVWWVHGRGEFHVKFSKHRMDVWISVIPYVLHYVNGILAFAGRNPGWILVSSCMGHLS